MSVKFKLKRRRKKTNPAGNGRFQIQTGAYSESRSDPALAGEPVGFLYKYETEWTRTPNPGLEYIRTPQIKLRSFNKIEKENLTTETQALDDLSGGLNEISEIVQLKLQMVLYRRTKYIAALSVIMNKISQTQDAVRDNIK